MKEVKILTAEYKKNLVSKIELLLKENKVYHISYAIDDTNNNCHKYQCMVIYSKNDGLY